MHDLSMGEVRKYIIDSLRSNTENNVVEFKDCRAGFTKSIWRSVSSFSNTIPGGLIVFGVEESQKDRKLNVVGGLDLATLQEKILSFISHNMENVGKHSLKIINLKDKDLLVLLISSSPREKQPCYYKELGLPRGACIREGNIDRVITDEEMRSFLRYSPEYKFDKQSVEEIDISDLSEDKINGFLEKSAKRTGRTFPDSISWEKVLINLGLAIQNNSVVPTIAGTLTFFKDDPQVLEGFSRYEVRCVKYKGNSASTPIIDQQDILGTLDRQIDGALKFVLRNIALSANVVGSKREEKYEYPEEALREVIANAVIHRDYQITGTYVQIGVYANRIEISNPGTLPPGINVENLKESQFSRNEIIANVMRDLDYMEEFGRGIDLIYSKMKEWRLAEPLFKNSANTFKVTLLGEDFKDLNERQVGIWYYLQDKKKITAAQAHGLYSSLSRPSINNDLRQMVELELIHSKGSSSNTYYEPNY